MSTIFSVSRLSAAALAWALCGAASAGVVIGATGISSAQGSGSLPLANIINQSSLSAAYVSGVTDFTTYTASTTAGGLSGAGFTNTESNGPQQFTFDLGASFTIDAIALWQSGSVGSVTRFEVWADDDADFSNGVGTSLLGPTALSTAIVNSAQVFALSSTTTRFVHVNGLASQQAPDFYGLNEVVFSGTTDNGVPEPGTLALVGLAALLLAGNSARRVK